MEIDNEVTSLWCSQVAKEAFHTKHVKLHQSLWTIKEVHDQTKIVYTIKSPYNITTLYPSLLQLIWLNRKPNLHVEYARRTWSYLQLRLVWWQHSFSLYLVMFIMRKWSDLQLALQLGFWVTMTICNLLQFISTQCIPTSVSVIQQIAWVAIDATHHMWNRIHMQSCNLITTIHRNNYCETLMQLICNYHGNVMIMSFSSIH